MKMEKDIFIKKRTEIISELLDNPDEFGIYPTTRCYARLDDLYDSIVATCQQPSWAQLNWFWEDV